MVHYNVLYWWVFRLVALVRIVVTPEVVLYRVYPVVH